MNDINNRTAIYLHPHSCNDLLFPVNNTRYSYKVFLS